jgi:hypothetical protein
MVQDIDHRNPKKVYKKKGVFKTASSLINEGGAWGRQRDRESFVPKNHDMMRNRKITRNLPETCRKAPFNGTTEIYCSLRTNPHAVRQQSDAVTYLPRLRSTNCVKILLSDTPVSNTNDNFKYSAWSAVHAGNVWSAVHGQQCMVSSACRQCVVSVSVSESQAR